MAKKIIVETECFACSGTGLYSGMCEAEREAVVCVDCDGTGCYTLEYTPFMGRKRRKGIDNVIVGRATKSILESNEGLRKLPYKVWFKLTQGFCRKS